MTHYTVTFTGTPREKLARAIAETRGYLGHSGQTRLINIYLELRNQRASRIRIRNIATAFCLFNGVGGYWPERAIRRFLISGQWR